MNYEEWGTFSEVLGNWPKVPQPEVDTPLGRVRGRQVMVWIHGGSLAVGSATSHDGSALAAYGNVVVVTVQYHLGIFGFLSTGDKHMPGNRGFLDVVAALRWVQGNIAPFGGDPKCVTIFGPVSNVCGALPQSHIPEWGCQQQDTEGAEPMARSSALDPDSDITVQYREQCSGSEECVSERQHSSVCPQTFANSLACSSVSSAELVQCLLQKEGRDLNKQKNVNISYISNDSFFPRSPEKLLTEKQFPTVPYLLGVNNHEFGWLMLKVWDILDKLEHLSREELLEISRPFLSFMDMAPEIMPTVIDKYLDNGSDEAATRYAFQELLGDIVFVIPTLNFSRHLQDAGCPVFLYEFQHTPSSFAKFKPAWVKADHGSESPFIFGGPFLTDESNLLAFPESTEEEKQLSLTMMAQWTQFAHTGNPNGKGLPSWPQLNQLEQYLEIGLEPRTGVNLKKNRLEFWSETLPRKIQEWYQQQKSRKSPEEL
ncbi:hypothetical protein STEG23_007302 [Scotinomys teguina]